MGAGFPSLSRGQYFGWAKVAWVSVVWGTEPALGEGNESLIWNVDLGTWHSITGSHTSVSHTHLFLRTENEVSSAVFSKVN